MPETLELDLKRVFKSPTYTIGVLSINGNYFCDTLEDTVRDFGPKGEGKIKGETAIPYGRYEVVLDYSARFKKIMPHLLNVPFFEGIRIHSGNKPEDTEGCILVGKNIEVGKVLSSRVHYARLFTILSKAEKDKKSIFITIH